MQKFLIMAVVAVVATAGYSVIASADAGTGGTSWDFTFSTKKVNTATSSDSVGHPAKKDENGKYVPPKTQTFGFPKGSRVDTTALKVCKLTDSQVGQGEDCPENTRLGSGSAKTVVGQTDSTDGTILNSEFSAWNKKNKILFIFQPCGTGTGPGTGTDCAPAGSRIIVIGTWKGIDTHPLLTVPTPQSLLDIGIIIIEFKLHTDKHVVKKGGKIVKSYIFTPKTCKGKWKTYDKASYTDGTSQTIPDSTACKKP